MSQVGAGRSGRPMRADARRNYERLLQQAAIAFAEHGENASLDDIAKRSGVGSGTLYRHFPTRQDLLEAVYVDSVEEIAARGFELLAGSGSPGDALREWLAALAEQMTVMKGLKGLLGSVVTDNSSSVISACSGTLKRAAGELLAAAQEAGAVRKDLEPTELLRLVHAAVTAAEMAAPDGTRHDPRRYLTLMTEGLGGPAA